MFEGDICKTAIITPFGLYEFVRMPFGLKNSAQAFQRLMDHALRQVPHAFVYLDDILIASSNRKEHLAGISFLFETLEKNGMVVNRAKCELGIDRIDFLGHSVSAGGIKPLPVKVEAVRRFPRPDDVDVVVVT